MKCTLLAIFAATLALVSAEIKISKPIASTTWKFGSTQSVEWTVTTETGPTELYLYYLNGSDPKTFQAKEYVAKVSVPDVKAGKAKIDLTTVNLTKYPPTANQYFIRIGDVSGGYSSQFTITGGTGSPAPAAATAVAGAATAAGAATTKVVGATTAGAAAKATITRTVTATATPAKATSDATTNAALSFMAVFAAFIALFL